MSDTPASPFARLDTNLLRETRPTPAAAPASAAPPAPAPPAATTAPRPSRPARREPTRPPVGSVNGSGHRDTAVDTTTPRHRDATASEGADDIVDVVRKAVKTNGKEGATLRLTPREKDLLKELVYTYSRRRRRTSETELIRIATNYMLEDWGRHGEDSILARVMAALDS